MHIGLMSHVKEQAVLARVEDALNGDRQLHHAEVRGEMSARPGDIHHQKLPQLIAQQAKLLQIQRAEILGGSDFIQ